MDPEFEVVPEGGQEGADLDADIDAANGIVNGNGDDQSQQSDEQKEEEPEAVVLGQDQDVMSAVLGQQANRQNAVSPISIPREEPETIKQWRAEQEKRLAEKDAKEGEMMEELRERAKKELHDWYSKYEEQLDKTKSDNRVGEKQFVAQMDHIEPGTEWDRVSKLCEFNAKKQNSSKDMSRMRYVMQ